MSSQFFFREKRKIHAYNEHVNGKRKTFPKPERHEQQTIGSINNSFCGFDSRPYVPCSQRRVQQICETFITPRVDFVSHLCGQRDGLTG